MSQVHFEKMSITEKLVKASPLMPAIFAALVFIAILSPVTWSVDGYFPVVVFVGFIMSILISYCIVSFVENIQQ